MLGIRALTYAFWGRYYSAHSSPYHTFHLGTKLEIAWALCFKPESPMLWGVMGSLIFPHGLCPPCPLLCWWRLVFCMVGVSSHFYFWAPELNHYPSWKPPWVSMAAALLWSPGPGSGHWRSERRGGAGAIHGASAWQDVGEP